MMQIKQWIWCATSLALLCILAACGVPATGSTISNAPTVGSAATAGSTASADPTITPDTLPTDMEVSPDSTPTADGLVMPDATFTPDASATASGPVSNEVDGTSWKLTEFGPADAMVTANGEVTVIFGPGDKISGNSGCNSYGGTYTLNGTAFSVSDVGTTMMACMDNSLMEQESAFGAALNSATDLAVNGDELRITYSEGTLRFNRLATPTAAPIEGTVWQLESIVGGTGDDASASSLVSGSSIRVEWDNGTVTGTAGCNQFSAPYTLEGETLTVGEIVTTEIGCEASIMQQEKAFADVLGTATSLKIDGTNLVLAHPNGQLVFRSDAQ